MVHVIIAVQLIFYEATQMLNVRKRNQNNDFSLDLDSENHNEEAWKLSDVIKISLLITWVR